MNSHRSSNRFPLSPTVVQSPSSPASHGVATPVTPLLQVDMDRIPLSQSFPGMMKPPSVFFPESGCARRARLSKDGMLNYSDSFHIECIPNVKEIDPEWEHDEIEEIMVISPNPKARNSFLVLGESQKFSVDDFEVLRVVGKELSFQTILARNCSDFRVYAIKTLGKRAASSPNLLKHVRSEQACLRIVTEGDCPFLPRLHRSFHDEARLYMVLDTYPGGSIAMHLGREGTFAGDKARFYASEIVEALSYLHSLHIVHRDIKPENVMIAADGHIIVTNFSHAKMLDQSESTSSDCGTREFEAPERILGWAYDYAADIWSFGVFLCIMHFGLHPFLEGGELDSLLIMQKRILRGQAPRLPSHLIPLSEWNLIKKCLERNAHLRPDTARVKTHEYFFGIEWDRVRGKDYPAPYIPYGDEVDILDIDEEIFYFHDKPDLLKLDNSPSTDPSDFDGFSFTWDPNANSPGDRTLPRPPTNFLNHDTTSSTRKNNIRSILKRPSIYFAGNPKATDVVNPGSFLDLNCSPAQSSPDTSTVRPRKLRKKCLSGSASQALALSPRRSIVSMLSEFTPSKRGAKKSISRNKTSTFCESTVLSGTINLPKGIVQTGQGIGFTYTPQASCSRLSLSSVKEQSCLKSISMLFVRHGGQSDDLSMPRNEVMHQVYASTWSMHTNDTQMSTGSFVIPGGLGRRVDPADLQRQQPSHS